jgi:hypothetical protein
MECINSSKGGGEKMELNTRTAKGIALFVILVGAYAWIGQGANIFEVAIVLFAAFLILGIEHNNRDTPPVTVFLGESDPRHSFFKETSIFLNLGFLVCLEQVFFLKSLL